MKSTLGFAALVSVGLLIVRVAGLSAQEPDDSSRVVQIPPLTVEVLRSPLVGMRTPFAVAGIDVSDAPIPATGGFLADALRALPGLEIQNRHNFAVGERLSVRGFGARSQFGVRGLSVVLDGIPATLPDGQTTLDHVDPAVLGRVELLRGPGSAWYGNGAGGVLLMESARTPPGRHIEARTFVGSLGRRELSARASDGGAAAGDPSTSLAVTRFTWDGFRSNPVEGGLYGAADRTIVTARHRRTLGSGELVVSGVGLDLDAENPGSLPADSLGDPDRSAWGFNVRQRTGKTVRQGQVGASWRGDLGRLGSDAAMWAVARELRNPIPGTVIEVDRTVLGGRLGLERSRDGLTLGAGLEAGLQMDDRRNFGNDDGLNGDLRLDQDEQVRGVGAFIRAGTRLGQTDIHAALRYDAIRFTVDDRFTSSGDPDDSGARSLDAWSPSLGVALPIGAVDFFGSIASFLETPTTTELANRPDQAGGFNPALEPTRGWTGEIGARGSAGSRFGWEFVAFQTALRDELVPFEVASDPGRTFFRNVGESSHQGVEMALRGEFRSGFSFRSALTHVDARFEGGVGEGIDGNRIPGRAPTRFETRASLSRGSLVASTEWTWAAAVPVDDVNSAEAPSWFRADVRVGLSEIQLGSLAMAPWVEVGNVTDTDYVGSVTVNAFGGRFFEPAPGRTFSIGLRANFD